MAIYTNIVTVYSYYYILNSRHEANQWRRYSKTWFVQYGNVRTSMYRHHYMVDTLYGIWQYIKYKDIGIKQKQRRIIK